MSEHEPKIELTNQYRSAVLGQDAFWFHYRCVDCSFMRTLVFFGIAHPDTLSDEWYPEIADRVATIHRSELWNGENFYADRACIFIEEDDRAPYAPR